MPASEYAYPDTQSENGETTPHPATLSEYTDQNGIEQQRELNKAKIEGQMSELALGLDFEDENGEVKDLGFNIPVSPSVPHDYNPDK